MNFNILKPFDYFFYRNYIYYKKKKDLPFFSSVITTSLLFEALTSFIWYNIKYVTITKDQDIVVFENFRRQFTLSLVIVFFSYYIVTYFMYKKRKEKILKEFKGSKYNRIIPYWFFPTILIFTVFLGLIPTVYIQAFLEENNMEGIVFRWLFS